MTSFEPGAATSSDTQRYVLLAQRFVALADTLVDDYDVVGMLDTLVEACVELLDVSEVGLLLIDSLRALTLVASSSESTRLLEVLQVQSERGPCVDCVRTGSHVAVPDIAGTSQRWPQFAAAATAAGFRSMHAVPL